MVMGKMVEKSIVPMIKSKTWEVTYFVTTPFLKSVFSTPPQDQGEKQLRYNLQQEQPELHQHQKTETRKRRTHNEDARNGIDMEGLGELLANDIEVIPNNMARSGLQDKLQPHEPLDACQCNWMRPRSEHQGLPPLAHLKTYDAHGAGRQDGS